MPVQGQGRESLLGKSTSQAWGFLAQPPIACLEDRKLALFLLSLSSQSTRVPHGDQTHGARQSPRRRTPFRARLLPARAALPHPRLSAHDSLEGLPPSQRPIARGCFWTLATSTCEGLTSRPLFPTVLSKRSLHRTNMIKAQNPTRQSFRGSTDEQPLLGQPGIFQRGSIRSCPPTHSSGHTPVLPGSTQTARPTPTRWFRGRMRC